jgi:glycosyltransferase involved in cell wall biosynthesis
MKVLFCHDGPLRKDGLDNYYGTAHNDESFRRYYTIADELTVAIRVSDIKKDEAENKLSKITVSPFEVKTIPNLGKLSGIVFDKNKAEKIIKEEVIKADYIIARLPSKVGVIALKYANELKKPSLIELVACQWDSFWYHSLKGKAVAPLSYRKIKKTVNNANAVVYITEQFLQSRYPTTGESYICPNVALKPLDPSILENRFKLIDSMKENNRISIASVGATNMRYKGHEYMIKAIKILFDRGYDLEYHIIGGGDNSRLKKVASNYKVADRILFHGSVPHDDIFAFLDNVHLYVQPSLAEAQGRSLIEAMSRGCPCICTNVGGMPELIQNELIAKKKDPRSLADKLMLILDSDLKTIASRNFNFAKKFDKEIINKRRIEIFKEVF